MAKVITFGELMLRLQPYDYLRFVQADSFEATFGGGEANVAVSLANYGLDARFVTKLPEHAIGQMAVNSLRKYGVDTRHIVRGGDRVGIYFLEKERRTGAVSAFMTAPIPRSRRRTAQILTGTAFLKGRIGSILRALRRRLAQMLWKSAVRRASRQRSTA